MNTFIKLLASLLLLTFNGCDEAESVDPEKAFHIVITNGSNVDFTKISGKFGDRYITKSILRPGESTDTLTIDGSYLADIITMDISGEKYSLVPNHFFVTWVETIPGRTYNYELKQEVNGA